MEILLVSIVLGCAYATALQLFEMYMEWRYRGW